MVHWYFSPHPDDAALSCGGQIATLTRQGERVVVITVMAGDPPEGFKPTPFVEELWARWGLGRGNEATAARRAEDEAAMTALGAEIIFLEWPDAVYRISDWDSSVLYPTVDAIFGRITLSDPANRSENPLAAQMTEIEENDTLHFPLGVGHHVDHQIISRLSTPAIIETYVLRPVEAEGEIAALEQPFYYEEYPYSLQGGAAIENAFIPLLDWNARERFKPVLHPIDSAALDAKTAAIACYKSQISSFWNSLDDMDRSVREYTAQVGGEREWQLTSPHISEAT